MNANKLARLLKTVTEFHDDIDTKLSVACILGKSDKAEELEKLLGATSIVMDYLKIVHK